jgi:probable HAF family extracellular repeat protein
MAEVRSSIEGGVPLHRHLLPVVLSLSVMLSALATAQDPSYTFTSIDVPDAQQTMAFGINDHGQIVGTWGDAVRVHGFLLDHGTFTTIDVPDSTNVNVFGINK